MKNQLIILQSCIFYSETKIDASVVSDTKATKKHETRWEKNVSFGKITFKILQKIHFQYKVIKFVLGYIPIFDEEIYEMKKKRMHFHH